MLALDQPAMTTTTVNRPRTRLRHWTYARYRRLPDDRKTHEILDGKHFARPSPTTRHQEVAGALMCELMELVHDSGRGTVLACRCDLHLAPCTVVHPDLVVILRGNLSILGKQKITGVPDLIVEVLSPEYRDFDCRVKRDRYERAGVPEYWIVDPDSERVEQHILRCGAYDPPVVVGERVQLHVLRGAAIDLRRVWRGANS